MEDLWSIWNVFQTPSKWFTTHLQVFLLALRITDRLLITYCPRIPIRDLQLALEYPTGTYCWPHNTHQGSTDFARDFLPTVHCPPILGDQDPRWTSKWSEFEIHPIKTTGVKFAWQPTKADSVHQSTQPTLLTAKASLLGKTFPSNWMAHLSQSSILWEEHTWGKLRAYSWLSTQKLVLAGTSSIWDARNPTWVGHTQGTTTVL